MVVDGALDHSIDDSIRRSTKEEVGCYGGRRNRRFFGMWRSYRLGLGGSLYGIWRRCRYVYPTCPFSQKKSLLPEDGLLVFGGTLADMVMVI